jgi:hypothetical protein
MTIFNIEVLRFWEAHRTDRVTRAFTLCYLLMSGSASDEHL